MKNNLGVQAFVLGALLTVSPARSVQEETSATQRLRN